MEVVGIGNPVCDLLVNTEKFPEPDSSSKLLDYSWQGGGKVATAVVTLARLGAKAGIIGVVADDPFGRFCIKDFAKHGVDISNLIIDKNKRNTFCVDMSEPGSMSRSICCNGGSTRALEKTDIDKKYIISADFLHIENMNPPSLEAARIARENNMTVVIDADHYQEEIQNNIDLIDIFIGSEFYYNSIFTGDDYRANCREIQKKGPEVVIFTLGEKGCKGVYEDLYFEQQAFEVDVKDTTGAGDVFHGAFIFGLIQDWKVEFTARFASAVAAIKCTRMGGRAAIPDLDTVLDFLETGEIDYTEIDRRVKFYKDGIFN
ncbi:MAG: carbohydrate kinase family protein [Halanaerobiaceae bacterium]